MKPKAYSDKYATLPWNDATQESFHQDFCIDFQTVLELALKNKDQLSLSAFDSIERQMKEKFNSIRFKVPAVSVTYWDSFVKTVLNPAKQSVCAEEIRENRKRAQRNAEFQRNMDRMVNNMRERAASYAFEEMFRRIFAHAFRASPVPQESFTQLGIAPTKDAEAIKAAFRTAAKTHHPDTGGDATLFAQITEAKNRCLAYANQN